ncbi:MULTISPECIES: hypothetical protein [Erysipelotrichaceae]|uniref:hypothetical protein n=1 Tax=Erysipelotrichaceae TaxID=128827 RepID=UPI000E53405B|nr:hypothetical protein [Absiella sp. AM27-20]RHU03332.1 hypothetical protein DW716_16040 [Absiella sp. AM27-20]DAZ41443.1 MAG TPA: hypothetical protein [Caudoviricetes sp.]
MTTFDEIALNLSVKIPDDAKEVIKKDNLRIYYGLTRMYTVLGIKDKDIHYDEETNTGYCERDLSYAEIHLASLYAYESYLEMKELEYTEDIMGIKTITFEIKSLDKKPDAINNMLYQLRRWISEDIKRATGSAVVVGKAWEMKS